MFGLMGAAAVALMHRGVNPMHTGIGTTLVLNLLITFANDQRRDEGMESVPAALEAGVVALGLWPRSARTRPRASVPSQLSADGAEGLGSLAK